MDDDTLEHTLSTLAEAHVYKLPPRASASTGWRCQEWPKTNHIFSGRVVITACGEKCMIKLTDKQSGSLFAQCTLDNDNPTLSVEPVEDSSRYFVIRVSDGSGRYAYLGMGFIERADAFEFNVTLQDHVKHLRNAKEAEALAAAPAPPPQDLSLKGSISIGIPGSHASSAPRQRAARSDGGGADGLFALQPPPPVSAQPNRRRPVAEGSPGAVAAPEQPSSGANPFGSAPFQMPATSAPDPFANAFPTSTSDPFAAAAAPSVPVQVDNPFGDSPFTFDMPPSGGTSSSEIGGQNGSGWVAFG